MASVPLYLLSTQQGVWNVKPIRWKRAKPARRFCFHLVLVQISSRADYFDCFQQLAFHFDFQSALCHLFCLENALRVLWAYISVSICSRIILKMIFFSCSYSFSVHERGSSNSAVDTCIPLKVPIFFIYRASLKSIGARNCSVGVSWREIDFSPQALQLAGLINKSSHPSFVLRSLLELNLNLIESTWQLHFLTHICLGIDDRTALPSERLHALHLHLVKCALPDFSSTTPPPPHPKGETSFLRNSISAENAVGRVVMPGGVRCNSQHVGELWDSPGHAEVRPW